MGTHRSGKTQFKIDKKVDAYASAREIRVLICAAAVIITEKEKKLARFCVLTFRVSSLRFAVVEDTLYKKKERPSEGSENIK